VSPHDLCLVPSASQCKLRMLMKLLGNETRRRLNRVHTTARRVDLRHGFCCIVSDAPLSFSCASLVCVVGDPHDMSREKSGRGQFT